ncbi:MAG TPA: GNAT family N-acetyltransferase [Vicinamibacterales bacterium]|nr:GNAT family N-acetyltransferase [Vicinamibacterales bacterium]
MADIERYSPDDRRGLEQLYRRTYGHEAVDRLRFLWDWARRNPAAGGQPPYLVVREGPTLIAASPLTPVRVAVRGQEVEGSWSAGPLVVSERQRQGLGGSLLRAWDRDAGVAFSAGFTDATRQRLAELRWPRAVTVPCLVKPISRRALRRPTWPVPVNRLVSALSLPVVRFVARLRPLKEEVQAVRRFDAGVDRLWEGVKGSFDLAVRRDARYLNWKFMESPHVRYQAAVLRRDDDVAGYVVYRHVREPQGRVTVIVDLLTDPADSHAVATLAGWVDREARLEDSDKIRCYATHAEFRRLLRKNGYFVLKSDIDVIVKVNAVDVPKTFYQSGDGWHLTLGDGAMDH